MKLGGPSKVAISLSVTVTMKSSPTRSVTSPIVTTNTLRYIQLDEGDIGTTVVCLARLVYCMASQYHSQVLENSTQLKPSDFRLWPSSGGAVQNPSSERRHETMDSIALVIAISTPFSLTKNVFPYFAESLVQKILGRANFTPSPTLKFKRFPAGVIRYFISLISIASKVFKLTFPTKLIHN